MSVGGAAMTKTVSWLVGLALGLLIIAPPIGYSIPMTVNSYGWLYAVMSAGFLGMLFALRARAHWSLKALAVYLFAACFISQVPALSFNSYILVVVALWLFVLMKNVGDDAVVRAVEAAFWFQMILSCFQLAGKDTLVNFDRPIPVFVGSVMQYMRFGSVLAVMVPFLMWRSKWYAIPVAAACIASQSSGFALSLVAGALAWAFLKPWGQRNFAFVASMVAVALALYGIYDLGSVRGAILPENGGRLVSWWAALQTWVLDTAAMPHPSPNLVGPWRWGWFFFGHGADTFLPLFPIYKHDMNPFPQAHNDWLQMLWEIGIVGTGLVVAYAANLIRRLHFIGQHGLIAGLAVIGTNMFFAFPMRLTQSMFLIVAYLTICERRVQKKVTEFMAHAAAAA